MKQIPIDTSKDLVILREEVVKLTDKIQEYENEIEKVKADNSRLEKGL